MAATCCDVIIGINYIGKQKAVMEMFNRKLNGRQYNIKIPNDDRGMEVGLDLI